MIQASDVFKTYEPSRAGGNSIAALNGVSLHVAQGEAVALMGASGSGKSTLLHLLGGLDQPTRGSVRVAGQALETLHDGALSRFRRERLGFVFQFFHLIPTLPVLENVVLPARLAGSYGPAAVQRAENLIERVGLGGRAGDPPDALSGGQQQRIALARALLLKPAVLLADEPTGNLDSANSAAVLALLKELVREQQTTLVMATHSADAAAIADRIVRMKDGLIEAA